MESIRKNRMRVSHGNIFKKHIEEHKGLYLILFLLFIIGFIIGSINAACIKEEIKLESQNYILEFVKSLKTQEIDNNILLIESIEANIKPIVYIMLFGLVIIGIPFIFIYIGIYSYSIGFTVTTILSSLGVKEGLVFIFTLMIPQEIILLPTIMIMAVNAILFSKIILNMGMRNINIKKELAKYICVFIMGLMISLGIALFETYIGSNLIKFAVKMM